MAIVQTSRISIAATRDVHDVGYSPAGIAYCKHEEHHHWKYGDENFADRSKNGYISFGDRQLGGSVEHRVKVYPGEDYGAFWTRIRQAEDKGYIETMHTSAYSSVDKSILEMEGIPKVTLNIMEVQTPGLTPDEEKAWLAQNKQDGEEPGIISHSSRKIAGLGVIGVAIIVALGYLLIMGGKK